MSGVSITVDLAGLQRAIGGLDRLADLDESELLTGIGSMGENQTRRRIESEKTSPDGVPWKPNREGTPTLLRSGDHLHNSLAFEVGSGLVRWGASWEYAHVHQYGATIVPKGAKPLSFTSGGRRRYAKSVTIPARPFVGLSAENSAHVERLVTDFLGRGMRW